MKKTETQQETYNTKLKGMTVGFFITCIVDLLRPSVGFEAIRLLHNAGCEVSVPVSQACCGQPTYNRGDNVGSMAIARQVISVFDKFDYVVVPSGSCAGMIRKHYPRLFSADLVWLQRARQLSEKTFELTQFLVDVLQVEGVDSTLGGTCTYHDSCSGLRELGLQSQPRQLLSTVKKLELYEMEETTECCGFGGLFCIKYPEISTHMVRKKAKNAVNTKADLLLGGDLGCLVNIAGFLNREDSGIRVFHVAEALADMTDGPGICENERNQDA